MRISDEGIYIEALSVGFQLPQGKVEVLKDLGIAFKSNQINGIIGESGSGKSVLGMAILGILPPYAEVQGRFVVEGTGYDYGSPEQKKLWGRQVGFIPQNPQEALNPARKIKAQLMEALTVKYKDRRLRQEKALEMLVNMGFESPEQILKAYPHELSGGMQQRALAALSVCCTPQWIIADEPTKGLDAALCQQVAETFKRMRATGVKGMLVITHDIHLAKMICDEIFVMYEGRLVEAGKSVLQKPRHPYSKALLGAMPENGMCPIADKKREKGTGCIFAERCPACLPICQRQKPSPRIDKDGFVECFLYE